MNIRRVTIIGVLIASLVLIVAGGCKKSEPETAAPTSEMEKMAAKTTEDASKAVTAVAASLEQTVCPVMGQPINKDLFVEYQGKKVYFCCPGCEEKFKAEPEKYVAKLPQFEE
jgi:YHS domain-containing protein